MKSPPVVSRGMEESPSNERNNNSHKHYCPICMLYFRSALETRCCSNTMCDACATAVVSRSAGHTALHHLIEAHTPPRPTKNLSRQHDAGSGGASTAAAEPPAALPPPVLTTPRASTSSTNNHRHYVRQVVLLRDGSGLPTPPAITVVPCPFCQRNLKLKVMDDKVVSKSYEDSPMVQRFRNNVANSSRLSSCEQGDDSALASDTSVPLSSDASVYSNTMATFRLGSHSRSTEAPPVAKVSLTSPVKTGDSFDALRRKLVALPLWGPKPSTGTASAQPSSETTAAPPIPSATALPRIPGRERRTLSNMPAKKSALPALVPVAAKKETAPEKSSWCPIM